MRRLVLAGFLLCWGAPADAAVVAAECFSSAPSSNGFTAAPFSTLGANLYFVITQHFNFQGDITLSDSTGTTYTMIDERAEDYITGRSFYAYAPNPSGSLELTITGNAGGLVCFVAWAGVAASPLDQNNEGSVASNVTVDPGASGVTPSVGNTVICTGFATADTWGGTPPAIDESFTILDTINRGSNANGGGIACLEQAVAAQVTPTWTVDTASKMTAFIANFKLATNGVPGGLSVLGTGR